MTMNTEKIIDLIQDAESRIDNGEDSGIAFADLVKAIYDYSEKVEG